MPYPLCFACLRVLDGRVVLLVIKYRLAFPGVKRSGTSAGRVV